MIKKWLRKLNVIGPGFITGAADNDPSGLSTYSIAGAQFGYRLTWLSLFLIPSMIVIQEMCGRIGLTTGRGLAGVIKKFYSKKILYLATGLLFISAIINIAADLGIIASSMQMIFGFYYYYWLAVAAVFIVWMEIAVSYKQYSKFLIWLGLAPLVYVLTAFLVKQDWQMIIRSTLVPTIELTPAFLMTMVAFVGTTISPTLFFWQAAEEVEEEIAEGKIQNFNQKPETKPREIKALQLDTKLGMIFSNVITFFIILTTAATLHAHGISNIQSPQQAAEALRPLAGNLAFVLFGIGMIGSGCLSIPVFAGAVAYTMADVFRFPEGLSKNFTHARKFYSVIALATIIGVVINAVQINAFQALYYAAMVSGVLSIPLMIIIIKLADDERVVGKYKTKKQHKIIAWVTVFFVVLTVAAMVINFG